MNALPQTRKELYELVYQAAGAATAPLLQDHPTYVFPSERVAEGVERVIQEHFPGDPPHGYQT